MKVKVSNYISQYLVDHGIDHAFSVTGGGAMHLNDAFGHQPGMHMIYNHHEQACAIAAESYARIHNKIAACVVTTGPGGTNAITGVVGGWLDSIPMLIISGQVRYDTTARSTGLGIRAMGDQEFDITKAVDCMTKYCEMVIDPLNIKYCLDKALRLAQSGRPGPCWLDIPLNVQGAYIDTDDLRDYDGEGDEETPGTPDDSVFLDIIERVKRAERPVFNAGNGIRIAGAFPEFSRVIEKLGIPVVTGWDSIDLMEDEHPLYAGRPGIMGDRPGNWAVQNSDLLLSVGSRLSIRQVGYNYQTWARAAYKIVVDVDPEELKKPTVDPDMPICADAKAFLDDPQTLVKISRGDLVSAAVLHLDHKDRIYIGIMLLPAILLPVIPLVTPFVCGRLQHRHIVTAVFGIGNDNAILQQAGRTNFVRCCYHLVCGRLDTFRKPIEALRSGGHTDDYRHGRQMICFGAL